MMLEVWGALPFAAVMLFVIAERLARIVLRATTFSEHLAAAVTIAMAIVHLSTGWLAHAGLLTRATLLGLLGVMALAAVVCSRWVAAPPPWPRLRPEHWVLVTLLGALLLAATATARIVPIWQWDSIGYHLPFVQFVVQAHGFAGVPDDVRYISTYPHNIELAMIWLRVMLPDDRLVDFVQVPYGFAGAILTAALARRLGAARTPSLLAGIAWLAAPGVFLQLPTNYVDVGTATALLAAIFFLLVHRVELQPLALGGVALGLFLGSKPSAPLATAVVLGGVLIRCWQARRLSLAALAGALTLVFGGEMYVRMTLDHGNPVWPVQLTLGPWVLPGTSTVDSLLAAGAALPRASGSWLERLTLSWLAVDTTPVFDMRLGGFGVLFLLALPAALLAWVNRRSLALTFAVGATLAVADPSMTRYVLAFAALTFALAAVPWSTLAPRGRPWFIGSVLVSAVLQVGWAWPALVGDGPSWSALWAMSDDERREAVGPQGTPAVYTRARALVSEHESAAFDEAFEFPSLLWEPTFTYPVHFVPDEPQVPLRQWAREKKVRLLALGPKHRRWLEADAAHWARLFECVSAECTVYVRVDERASHETDVPAAAPATASSLRRAASRDRAEERPAGLAHAQIR